MLSCTTDPFKTDSQPAIPGSAPLAGPSAHPTPRSPPSPPKTRLGHLQNSSTAATGHKTSGERYDAYAGALFYIPGTPYRIAVCSEGRQWVLQRRKGSDQWIGIKFFSNKRRLAVVLRQLVGPKAFDAVKPKLDALPI